MFRKFAKKLHSLEDATIGRLRRIHPALGLAGYLGLGVLIGNLPFHVGICLLILVALIFLVIIGEKYKKEDGEL